VLLFDTCTVDTGDINVAFSFPAGCRLDYGGIGPGNTAITGTVTGGVGEWIARAGQTTSPSTAIPFGADQSVTTVTINGLVEVGSTAGTLTVMWAQVAAAGTTTVKVGSWMRLERMA
jgi:hypothetical protein